MEGAAVTSEAVKLTKDEQDCSASVYHCDLRRMNRSDALSDGGRKKVKDHQHVRP